MIIGIDKMASYTPEFALDLTTLAFARGDEPEKYTIGIGQNKQAVIPNFEDVVTMGVNAARKILTVADREQIDMVIFATESGIDNSKSAAIYAQRLLGLSSFSRTIELKQACYAGTYGLMQANDYVRAHPDKRVLVIASDIARYGIATPGEVTQGGGAIAMIVSQDPKLLAFNDDSVYMSQDVADFWRPLDRTEAIVDGHLSTDIYKEMFLTLWQRYKQNTNKTLNDFAGFAFHLPYTKMGKKALDQIIDEAQDGQRQRLLANLEASQLFSREVGNLYTGSVYLSLLSLISNSSDLLPGEQLAIFSYGSGAEAELYSVTLQKDFHQYVPADETKAMLAQRHEVTVAEYETMFNAQLHHSYGESQTAANSARKTVQFWGWRDGQRIYQ